MNLIKSMLLGIALAAVTAVAPVLAADKSADFNALKSDSHALSQKPVQERTKVVPLSTEQLDSIVGGKPPENRPPENRPPNKNGNGGGCTALIGCIDIL
jgi:hypothetical protein